MSKQSISDLKEENRRLNKLANYDELTGIYNRRATELNAKERLTVGCAVIVCDLDDFKSINDRLGHLMGDACIKKAAELLTFFIDKKDVIGRVGGDEFVIVKIGNYTQGRIDDLCTRIEKRFIQSKHPVPFKVSCKGEIFTEGDTYQSVFDRADQKLLLEKVNKKGGTPDLYKEDFTKDIDFIQKDLSEHHISNSAYYLDYEAFRSIYCFIERLLVRKDYSVSFIVFSISDNQQNILPPQENDIQMEYLRKILKHNLRNCDIYTRYSANQYLVTLVDTTLDEAEIVSKRIKKQFEPNDPVVLVWYSAPFKTLPKD